MNEATITNPKKTSRSKQGVAVGALILTVIIIVFLAAQLTRPKRSVAEYCKVYSQEKTRLSKISNDSNPYPSGVFNVSVNDAGQIADSFGKLDRVAPTDIEPNVSNLQKLYKDIHSNPSHAINDSLNGGSIDDSLKSWTQQHC